MVNSLTGPSKQPRVWRQGKGRWSMALAMTLALIGVTGRAASPANKARTVEELESAHTYPAPRAFIRGNNVRIYYAIDGRPVVFKAEWKKARLEGRDYTYRLAELNYDKSPPRLPSPHGFWHEVTVQGQNQWTQMAQAATERLTGPIPWQGTFLQLLDTERVLYRDDGGNLHAVKPDAVPPEVTMVHRYNAQEFATTMSQVLETSLKATASGQNFFLLVDAPPGRIIRFILLDVAKRRCVLLYAPRIASDPKGGPELLTSAKMLGSTLFESHGVALLKNPVSAAGRLLNVGFRSITGLFSLGLPSFEAPVPPVIDRAAMDASAWEQRLDHVLGSPTDCGSMQYLINGEEFFPTFQHRLAEAQKSIHILVCIFDRDDVAVEIADLLKQRSKEIDVRVILDRMASQAAGNVAPATLMPAEFEPPKSIAAYLEHDAQVRVRPFLNPWFSCEHSKVFIIDGRYAYLGGMNIGREYRYEWHDLMVEVEGPVVAHFERDFEKAWAHAGLLGDAAFAEQVLFGRRPPRSDGHCPDWPKLRRLYTRTGSRQIRSAVMEALDRAQQCVYLENPYLYDNKIVSALAEARRRGVDVRIVLPSESDFGSADSSNYVTANYLLSNGVRVFIYPGMTHVKALIVDGWVCVGSANFNRLSMQFNQEVNLGTSDPKPSSNCAGVCSRWTLPSHANSKNRSRSVGPTGWRSTF